MNDLDRELRQLDRISVPDLTSHVDRAIGQPPRPERPALGVPLGRRLVAAVVAFAIFGAAGAFALHAFDRMTRAPATSPSAATDPLGSIPQGWTPLPSPPATRPGASDVWTGQELLTWGGANGKSDDYSPSAEGYAFDPAAGSWTSLPPAPIPGKYALATWAGTEIVFLGVGVDRTPWQAEAFDLATRTWRVLPTPPIPPRTGEVVQWTGSEVIVWGGGDPGEASNLDGAAYDPSTDTWRSIADAPFGLNQADGMWTGTHMAVFGALLDGRNIADTKHSVGESYDPSTDSWQTLAPSALSPQATAAVWLDGRMVAFDYGWKAASYDPATDSWDPLGDLDFQSGECYPDGAVVGMEVFAFGCGEAATLSPGDRTWTPIHGGLTDATIEANGRPYQLWRFATLVPAGDVLFLHAEGLTVEQNGEPCYGCAGSPTSLWAYRLTS
jgi:N-acetylneuraminic acid mutarotase